MITRATAAELFRGVPLYTSIRLGSDMRPVRCRVNGQPQLWKRDLERFRIPAKHGMYTTFQITNTVNGHLWFTDELEALGAFIDRAELPSPATMSILTAYQREGISIGNMATRYKEDHQKVRSA